MSNTKLLIAVSSPWSSQKFAGALVALAQRLEAQVVVAHIAHEKEEDESESDARQRGEETIKVLEDALHAADIDSEGVLLFSDDVPKAIINTARARGCTLIVLGASQKNRLRRFIQGDMPSRVLKESDVPVLICPAQWSGSL